MHSHAPVPRRSQVPTELRWNLEDIYPDHAAWEHSFAELGAAIDDFARRRGNTRNGPGALLDLLRAQDDLETLAERVWWYPALRHDEDVRDNTAEAPKLRVQMLLSRAQTEMAWVRPEILALGRDTVRAWIEQEHDLELYRFLLEDLFRQQEHVLDEARETLLSSAGPLGGTPSDAYSLLTNADVQWPQVELTTGETVHLTYSAYHHLLQTARAQEDRRRAFEALYRIYRAHRNTHAALYSGVCHRDWFHARARGFADSLEAALHGNAIPSSVVENLIATTRNSTAPLRRYHRLRKRALGLEDVHLYDAFVPLVEDDRHYEWDEAAAHVIDSVAPLGTDYQQRMRSAFQERWIDVLENEGKRAGAYSAPVYGVHPYVLMNYRGTLGDVFTLAHEMGHSLHTVLSHEHQPHVYAGYTIFVAEVASTLNEALLLAHLVRRSTDPRERIHLLQQAIDGMASTFHTQVMFAEYELRAHRAVERGEPLTADALDALYGEILVQYYGESGDAITHDEPYRSTWCRIPHLYRTPYYVYQYATSFASASLIGESILGGDDREAAVERYLDLLRSGGNAHPMDQLRRAGVDLDRPDPIEAVTTRFDRLVDQLEQELDALGLPTASV
jgi:oligoendopeptidase F